MVVNQILAPIFGFYNIIFQPLLVAGPYVSLGFFSAALAALFAIIYWIFLDVERADEIKEKLNDYQDKMKEAREDGKHDKASEHMKKTLQLNQKFMMLNMKPMLATVVFVGLFFPWLGSTYAPNIQMNETENGTFSGQLEYAGQSQEVRVLNVSSGIMVQSGESEVALRDSLKMLGVNWQVINFESNKDKPFDARLKLNAEFVPLPVNLPYIGDALNWLGFYFVLIMPLTYIFRKALGVQ